MSVLPDRLLLLDTTVLVDLLRDTSWGKKINAKYRLSARPEKPLLCSVVEGEVIGLARHRNWGTERLRILRELFDELVRVDSCHPEVIDAYADIYADACKLGEYRGPKSQNDLWIAATAKATGAALLTSDKDFLWMNGLHIEVHYEPREPTA